MIDKNKIDKAAKEADEKRNALLSDQESDNLSMTDEFKVGFAEGAEFAEKEMDEFVTWLLNKLHQYTVGTPMPTSINESEYNQLLYNEFIKEKDNERSK